MTRADTRWTHDGAGQHYEGKRFRTSRARERDPRMVQRLLERYGSSLNRVLDVPSGTGRLGGVLGSLSRNVTAIDISSAMLAECQGPVKLRGSAAHLPLRDDSYDAVVCCRLLHHLPAEARRQVVSELCRVSRGLVIASFWDATSWHAFRRRAGLRRSAHASSRRAVSRRELHADFEAAGATVLGHQSSLRFVSPQTFLAARVDGR